MNLVAAKWKGLIALLICPLFAFSQLQSPAEFLGYQVGTRFTRHHQIVSYFNAVAKVTPEKVKLMPYGKTNEGRDLLVAAISSPENMAQLENIRKHNLGLTEGTVDDLKQPAIVWLSYNVHGNEPASSEAAMLTLFALLDPSNKKSAEWLEHVVVMIDPCINPDGRDRYVNWYNNAVGTHSYNADQQAREHMEPWPSGRTNHYNFDLNRDWAWQTQVETKQRIPLYQQWYPQVHVDFHEQGYNEPYYFAPAAEPLHVLLTPWQKDFQDQIGKNHAKYFDQNNWLFFTKERFDLLYPSYGDTYPMYNGAIGMTYEQGGISAGLGVQDKNNDTVTLVGRALHHFTTGMSTVEISAMNHQKLITEFKKYYQNSRAGNHGMYQTYLMTSSSAHKIKAIADVLKKNNIQFGTYTGGNGLKAFDYHTKSEGNYTNEGYTIAVAAAQAHGVLASVLLDPITQVNDSNTYDITAWSLPYAFGVHGFATKEKLAHSNSFNLPTYTIASTNYGYLIPYNSFSTAKVLAQLLSKHIKVRYAEKAFTTAGRNFEKGTLMVLKTSNSPNWAADTKAICEAAGVEAVAVSTGYSEKGADFGSPLDKMINHAPKVALLTGEGVSALAAGEVWNYFEQQLNYPITQLTYSMMGRIDLNKYDVVIVPEGQYRDLNSKPMADKFQAFVKKGGVLIALESAAQQFASNADWGIKLKELPTPSKPTVNDLAKYGERVQDQLMYSNPGAIYKVHLDDTHPIGFGTNGIYYDLKQDMTLYEPSSDLWNVGAIKKDSYVTGFVGVKAKSAIQEGVVIGVKEMGAGKFVFMADDPIFRNFWEAGKLILANAVFLNGK